MNKFVTQLASSDKSIKETRAKLLSEQVAMEAESLVSNLRREKLTLQTKINQLTDLAPEENTSLRPGSKDFAAASWIKNLHNYKMQLKLKQIELDEAEAIYSEWFAEAKG